MNPIILLSLHPGSGRPPYHPKMMFKIILNDYINRIYSSCQIAKLLGETIYFMWLSGNQNPYDGLNWSQNSGRFKTSMELLLSFPKSTN